MYLNSHKGIMLDVTHSKMPTIKLVINFNDLFDSCVQNQNPAIKEDSPIKANKFLHEEKITPSFSYKILIPIHFLKVILQIRIYHYK